jgi:hypothetical protein
MLSEFKMSVADPSHVNRSDVATSYILQRFNFNFNRERWNATTTVASSSDDARARPSSSDDARAPPPLSRLGHASAMAPLLYATHHHAQDCHLLPAR